jgi:hypothetical protein
MTLGLLAKIVGSACVTVVALVTPAVVGVSGMAFGKAAVKNNKKLKPYDSDEALEDLNAMDTTVEEYEKLHGPIPTEEELQKEKEQLDGFSSFLDCFDPKVAKSAREKLAEKQNLNAKKRIALGMK